METEHGLWPADMAELEKVMTGLGHHWFDNSEYHGSKVVTSLRDRVFVASETNPYGDMGPSIRGEGRGAELAAITNSRTHVVRIVETDETTRWTLASLYSPADGKIGRQLAELLMAKVREAVRIGQVPNRLQIGMNNALLAAISPELYKRMGEQNRHGWVFDAGFYQEAE